MPRPPFLSIVFLPQGEREKKPFSFHRGFFAICGLETNLKSSKAGETKRLWPAIPRIFVFSKAIQRSRVQCNATGETEFPHIATRKLYGFGLRRSPRPWSLHQAVPRGPAHDYVAKKQAMNLNFALIIAALTEVMDPGQTPVQIASLLAKALIKSKPDPRLKPAQKPVVQPQIYFAQPAQKFPHQSHSRQEICTLNPLPFPS